MAILSKQGLTIPTKSKDEISLLEEINTTLNMWDLSPEEKAWYEEEKRNQKIKEQLAREEERIAKLQLKYDTPIMYRMKQKLTRTYDRYLANGQWFKASLKAFQGLGKKAGSWLMDILKFIFLLAIFDPKGKFLNSIIDFIIKMVEWLVDILIQYLPKIIRVMIFLITEVIPKVLKKIVDALSDMIYKIFDNIIKEMPEGPFKEVMKFIQKGFGEDGILRNFFKELAGLFPVFIVMLGVLTVIGKLVPLFQILFTVMRYLFVAIEAIYSGIQLLALILGVSAGWIVAIIAGIVLLGVVIWKFRDKIWNAIKWVGNKIKSAWNWIVEKISSIFDWFAEKFKKMGKTTKLFLVALSLLFAPITLFIYGLVKIFKSFKKIGVANTFKAMGQGIKNMAKGAKDWAASKISSAGNWISNEYQGAKETIGKVVDWTTGLASKLKNAIVEAWKDYIYGPFNVWFDKLSLYFKQFIEHPLGGGDPNKKAFAAYYQLKEGYDLQEAENLYDRMVKDKSINLWLEKVRKETGATDIQGNEAVVRAVNDLIEKLSAKQQVLHIDKSNTFNTSVRTIK